MTSMFVNRYLRYIVTQIMQIDTYKQQFILLSIYAFEIRISVYFYFLAFLFQAQNSQAAQVVYFPASRGSCVHNCEAHQIIYVSSNFVLHKSAIRSKYYIESRQSLTINKGNQGL